MKTIKILILSGVFLSTTLSVAQKTWSNNRYTFNNDGGGDKMYLNIDDNTAHAVEFSVGSSIDYISFDAPDLILDGDLMTTGSFKMDDVTLTKNELSSIKTLNRAIQIDNIGNTREHHFFGSTNGPTTTSEINLIGETQLTNFTEVGRLTFMNDHYRGDVLASIVGNHYTDGTYMSSIAFKTKEYLTQNQMIFSGNGKLGIGVSHDFLRTANAQKLEVHGNIASQYATMGTFGSSMASGAYFANKVMSTDTNYALAQDTNGDTYLNAKAEAPINFLLGNVLKMKLYTNGNLGIGTGASYVPSEKLEVHGNIASQYATMGTFGSSMASGAYFANKVMSTDTNYALAQDTNGDTYLNAKAEAPINFLLGNVLKMKLYTNGNLGIGTGASYVPSEKLEVNGNAKALGIILSGDGANTNTIDSNINGTIVFGGEDGSTLTDAQIADSFYPDFSVWVEEGIVTEDIAVAPSSEWDGSQPDYVFETDYELPSLEDVEVYVTSYKHLEGIPSKAEVAEKGWSLPSMDQKLLKKVEELTLYTIQQEKEIKALKALVENLVETIKN